MQTGFPSQTAWAVAAHRAAHQVLEKGRIFADPLALRILGEDADAAVREAEEHPSRRGMRIFVAARSRFAEDAIAAAVQGGVSQMVVLGAGLDTFAYRTALRDRLRIFEVDYSATQVWKRRCLSNAGIPIPASLTFAPIDFEKQTLAEGLAAAGFDRAQQTFFSWLGVVPYLTESAFTTTVEYIATMAPGSGVVFDYAAPRSTLTPGEQRALDALAARVARAGEPFQLFFEPAELAQRLHAMGFGHLEDLGVQEINSRYFADGAEGRGLRGGGGRLISARN